MIVLHTNPTQMQRDCVLKIWRTNANVLLLNAGSSSLRATLASLINETVIATGLTDWTGSVSRYQYMSSDSQALSVDVHPVQKLCPAKISSPKGVAIKVGLCSCPGNREDRWFAK